MSFEQSNAKKTEKEEQEKKEQEILSRIQELPEEGKRKILENLLSQEAFSESLDFIKNIQTNHYVNARFPETMGISCKKFSERVPSPDSLQNLAKALLVISEKAVPLEKQLELLGKTHQIDLEIDLNEIEDLAENPNKDEMYWIYDLDYGKDLTKAPLDARKLLEKQGGRGLTLQEAIDLIFQHKNILKSHFLLAIGSSYKDGFVPYISLTSEGKILIGARSPQCNMACFGTPSCKDQSKIKTPEAVNKK